jgi:hypothetical protein
MAYVKPIGDKVFYRVEMGLAPNKQVQEALEELRTDIKIDKDIFSLSELFLYNPFLL